MKARTLELSNFGTGIILKGVIKEIYKRYQTEVWMVMAVSALTYIVVTQLV